MQTIQTMNAFECPTEHRDERTGVYKKMCCALCAVNMIEALTHELRKYKAPEENGKKEEKVVTVYRLLKKDGKVYATVKSPEAVVRRQSRGMGSLKDIELVSQVPKGEQAAIASTQTFQFGNNQGHPVATYRFRAEEVPS